MAAGGKAATVGNSTRVDGHEISLDECGIIDVADTSNEDILTKPIPKEGIEMYKYFRNLILNVSGKEAND